MPGVPEARKKEEPGSAAMAEESSSGSSGSPGAGDTLPWNLGKHQRSQRAKAAAGNGTVLDPAERAVIRIADERDRVQKKTFTKWVNKHLIKAQRHVNDLYEDLRDGHNLISLLEVLSGDTLPREKGRMRFHKLQNVQIALNYLKHRQVKLVNIRNDDIADGNPKLTLGLIWTIILHFQISDIQVTGQSEDMTAKEKLLLWSQRMVEDYQGLRCDNFTTSWRDGRLFNAIIHRHRPMLIDMGRVYRQSNLENLDQAFTVAERELGVTRLLDPEDVDVAQPDEKSIITYVSSLYDAMPRVPEVQDGVKANELQLRWQEYYEVVTGLLQWSRQHSALFEERRLPASYEEIEILWRQFLKFKETELPAREADKNRSKAIFQALEGAVQSGQLKVPPGYHPLDVEKEWGRLHVAVLEREKLLRAEFERLERLQRVVTKLQMESGLCEEQLNQADALLQADVRLLAAGKAPQKAAEVERDLDKADAMIRLLFNDVQTLKDGRHPQGEQMYRRVYRLHERLVSIRTEYNLRLKSGAPAAAVTAPVTSAQRRPEPDEAPLRYLQELLAWVEENQRRVAAAEWGADLPTVETHLGAHRGLHRAIEEFRAKVERARADETQLSPGPSGAYRECLGKLELQYAKLLNSSKSRLRHLESLHGFVSAATKELLWLSEREEEEVAFDWSHNNPAMAAKKESYSALMRELELRERRIQELRTTGERLLREEHPRVQTLEAFLAALQTQWSWMLQLCCCIETHLKENTNYFQFFAEVREAEELLRKTEETMRRKFSCDRGTTATRLEDLLQDLAEQKEQLAELGAQLGGLSRRARTIVQLKPRSPSTPLQGRPPIQAVCDYKQMEVTVHKNDACALVNHAQPQQWRVLSAAGSEAIVPSVCFLLPPPNKEALDAVHRLESHHQQLLGLWQQLHQDLRSLRAWQYLTRDIQQIHSWTHKGHCLCPRCQPRCPPSSRQAFLAALQTQWSWMLQLCCCIETHLKENTNYFQFFAEVREAEELLRKTEETMRRKFSCDRGTTATRLEDLLQDLAEQKEQLAELGAQLGGLSRRARTIVQLKPRSPSTPLQGRPPIQAVCDYKQMEVTVHKNDACALVNHAQPQQWRVLSAAGSEAIVPSVCFLLPPPNKEALDAVHRLESHHQQLLGLWQQLHQDLRSLRAWQYLTRDIQQIHSWTHVTFRTLPAEEVRQVLSSLERHYQEFLRDSQDSQSFQPDDRLQVERDYNACTHKYELLLRSQEKGGCPSLCPLSMVWVALDAVHRLESHHQQLLGLWQQLHQDLRSLRAWQYLTRDIQQIHSWTHVTFRTLPAEEVRQVLSSLERHYQEFLRDSQDSQSFQPDDRLQVERDYNACTHKYELLLRSQEKGEQDESLCKSYISQLKDIRLQLESCESRTVHRLRLPLKADPLRECAQRQAEQQQTHLELEGIQKNLAKVSEKTEQVLAQPEQAGSAPVLRSELEVTLRKMEQVYSLSSIYLEKLKTIGLVIRSTQGAEELLRKYEEQLKDVQAVPADLAELEASKAELKRLRAQAEGHQPFFSTLETDLGKAKDVNERMVRGHSERDVDLERYRERVQQLLERWQAVLGQADLRQRELDQLGRQLGYYRQSCDALRQWIRDARQRQEAIQAVPITDSQAVREQLLQEKKLLEECEQHKEKVEECQRYAKQYIDAIKDYELQLVSFKAQVEPVASPAKKPKVQSASDSIIQEYVDLRTQYSELTTLTTQYIKFITETLRRLEDEEKAAEKLKEEERKRLAEVEAQLEKQRQLAEAHAKAKAQAEAEARELQLRMQEEVTRREVVAVDAEQQKQNIQQELMQLRQNSDHQIKSKVKLIEEAEYNRKKVEEEIRLIRLQLESTEKQRESAETELQELRARAEDAERQKRQAQEEAERLRRQVKEESQKKREAEEELKRKVQAEREAAREKQKAVADLEQLRLQAEEAERRMRQAEAEKDRQIQVAQEVAQRSAEAELQSKRLSFAEKTAQLELSLQQEHDVVAQLQEEAERLKRQQLEAERSREEAEKELEHWRQKANEALRLRLQAEEVAHKKSLAQEEAEKQKEDAEREARKRAKAEEVAVRQKELAEEELEKQRELAEGTAQQKLAAEQELIRLKAEMENGEQQRLLLEEELSRLKGEVNEAIQRRKELEEELAKLRAEMEVLLESKAKTEEESRSSSEKSKQRLEAEANKLRELAEEAARLRALSEEAKRQRQLAEDEASRQRAEAERILKEKLAAINEASRLKAEAEIALKEKEAENERLRRLAEDEAYQRKLLEEQAAQHKQDIEEKIALLKRSSESELERQKGLVEDTLRQRRQVEEEIRALKASFERASAGKSELERELNRIRGEAEEVQRSREQAEREAERQRALALEEEGRRREAEEKVQAILAAEEEAGRQRRLALEEVERLRAMVEEARRQKELAEKESERQIQLAREAAQKRIAAEEKAHLAAVQQKEQELLQTRQQEQSLLDRLREEAERARRAAEEAEFARGKAEQDASLSRQRVEEAERLKQRAEEEAQAKAQAQADAEKLRKEAELEAAKRAQAEQAALRQKQLADAEMEKHKKFAEQTLRQKAQVEQELTKVKLQLDETDHQKGILDEELQRLKEEVTDAVRQKAQVEEELFKVRVQMEELAKLKSRIEEENKALILKDKDNTQKFLAEEAEKMKQVAEEVARLSVEAQEAARMRQLAEDDLAQQRALAEKMLKEKMQAVQEATRLRAEAEMLQKQKDLAQEHAKKLQEDKEQMQQRLAEETEGFQKTLEAERRRQLDITAEAERLKLQVAEMSMAQAKAEEEAKRFKKQAEEISERLHETELATQEKMTMVHTLEIQRHQSDEDAEKLRKAIADLEKEKEKLKQEAALLQQKAEEMQVAQQAQLRQETQLLQQSFLTEKDALLQKEKFIEEEKSKLEKLFKDEVNKAQNLKAEQERQQREMEQEKQQLKAMLEEAKKHQKEAEENVRHKQEELQQLEKQRQQQEKLLEEENKKLRERLEQMQEEYKAALAQRREIMIQTDDLPGEAVTTTQLLDIKAVPNGRDAMDGLAQNGEPEFAFDGIRQKVSAEKLADAGILSRENLDKLAKGVVSVSELSQREDVKKYLQGKSSIAGLLIKPSNQKMSIYEAMKKKLLSPGTALVLLEAQAASGFIIDPVRNARLSVNEAVREGVIGPELHNKMLSAERAVTGYKDPYTGDKISLFQAMQKDLIVRDHGIRLLEAQIATGGIIDPVNSHRLPVEAAYKRGYFDEEMNQVLSDPTDDTKGFFDPNTQENLTYLQLMERCVTDPDTGLCLLPLTDQAAKGRELVYTDKEAKDVFKKATVTAPFGKFQGKTMTIWELINSEYFTEDQRRDLIQQYRTGKITVEKIIKIVITVVEESEKKSQMCFEGLRGPVPAAELLESKIINKDLYNQLHQGKKSVKDVAEMESVRQYLRGTDAIAGVLVESTGQKLTFYEALKRNLLRPEVALSLLEAQAATGYIIDPVANKLFSVDEAVKAEVVGPEFHEKLLSAEKAVTGYKDPYTGQTVSLYQALQKGLIPSDTGLRLLDVQLATGGIIDPVNSHRLPLEVAYKRGYFDPEINKALTEFQDEAKAFYCPNTQEHLTYAQLQKSCHRDKQTGLCLLPLSDKAIQSQQEEIYTDSQAKECFDKATIEVPVGSMKGQTMTIWELIHSEYFTEEHRRELLRQYKTGKVTIEKIIKIVITIIEEAETKKQEKLTFSGLRAPVPASELLESCIISKTQYEQLKEGKKSVKDLSETDAVRRFLHGSDCIAGVYVEATKEKLNIYEAMKRNLLRPSTAVVLLEAQAATGFLIDPVKNRKLYVNEAVKAGIVGPELHEKLLSAEKAVTGYKDPYSGDTISLFQAMKKGLIVKEHGIRLLEAQIATGGIIDPVHSHRLPVEVAYRRGYFDEEMNRTLSDPTDDTKGFFDPNTQENLTYVQLKERCIEDPETGLYLLPLREPEKPKVVETTHMYTEEETRKVFEETQVDIPVGSRAGSSMSLWDVMHSDLLPEDQRKHLMEEFQSGRVSKERMIIIIIEIIEKTEIIRQQNLTSYDYVRRRITAEDLYEAKIITQDIYNLLKQGSKTFRELLDVETVWKYLYGSGCVAGIYIPSSKQTLSVYQALKKGLINSEVARSLLEAQAATGFMIDPTKNEMLTVDEAVRKGVVGPEIHDRLLSAERAVTGYRDPYSEQKISLFQAMKKDLIPSEEALKLLDAQIATGGIIDPHLGFHLPLEVALQRGFINKETYDMLSEPSEVRSYVDPSTDEKLSYTQLLRRCRKDENSRLLLLPLCDTRKLTFRGLRKQITVEELVLSQVMDEATAQRLQEGLTSVEEVSKNLKKFLEGTSCIAGVFVDSTKERLSIYQAMKKGIIRPGTAFELLEAQAATGYVIDPIKGLKLTVEEAVRMGIVGPEFKDKLLSAERAVTGYRDPYTGKLISLFQAMKKGLILKDHGIRLLEAQIATGGIIDPEESHRLPVEVAYKRGLFDEEMNEILLDPSDDTKGFFDPNTEENLTYLQLMERCITDPETGLCLLPLKEKKRERKTSSKSSVRKRRVVIVDPETGKEMSVYEAYRKGLIDHQTYLELSEQECEWEEITTSSSDGVVKSMIIDRRSGRQYDIDDAIGKGLIDQSALDQYRSGTLSITEFADMLSGNMGGFRSRSSSVGSSSSYTVSPALSRTQISMWTDPTEETGPVAGILDTDTLEKVSITEAMRRNLVDNITGQRLLEAQACTGGIIDPNTGDKCTVADAVTKGLVDKIMVDRINLAQKAFYGFEDPRTKTKMSAAQALKKGWLYYEAGQRFLEVQYLTGGLIEPDAPGRVSLDEALQKGTIDARTAQKLRDVNTYSKYLTCPKTKLKISYKDAMDRSMIEDGTGLRLLEASSQSSKGYYSPYNISSAGSTSGSRSGSRTGSRSGSRRGSFDATSSGFSMTFSSSSYSSSSFGRRYTGGTQGTMEEAALALALAASRSCGWEASRECPEVSGPLLHPLHPKGGDCLGPVVHPTATNVPEEDITSSSALDNQTHHTSPEAAAWTPSTHPQCSEEGALHPSPPSCPISLPWPPGTSPPPRRRRAGALTTSFSSPNKDLPVPLGELLSWVSDISRSWMGSRGAPEVAAARPCSPAQVHHAAGDAGLTGDGVEGSPWGREEMERACLRSEQRLEVQEQLLALRHWLDAVEKRLLALPEPGTALQVSSRAVPVPEEAAERGQETLERLLAWVADMEELVSNQKLPSAEAKVVKAQLEEQKLLKRLLEERRPRVELVLQDKLTAQGSGTAEGSADLFSLGERWDKLMQEAEARYSCLERILPAAQGFQEAVDAFQEWLSATERQLAQLWRADGCVGRVQDAHQQTQALCEEIRGRLGELDGALESGQRVLELVTGEEAQLTQEKMESLRMRYLIAGQSSADTAHRLGQTLEASSHLGTAPEDLALWLSRMEKELGERESQQDGQEPSVTASDREKFEQVLESQLSRVAGLGERLEEIGRVQLDAEALRSQLSEQKLLSAEILHCRGLVERLLGFSEPLLRCCPEPLQERLQPSVQALRERTEQLSLRSGACAVQLEHAQTLLTQFSEALEELLPWLEETQALGVQLSPNAISYEAFKEQQALLQSLREAIAEHRPLVGKLQRVSAQLLELSPEQGAPFQRHWQEVEEQYGHIRERVRQAAALLEDALPRYSQLSERMDLLLECLERLQSRLQSQPPVRGDAAHLREQIRENSLALGELEKLGVALEGISAQGEELLATVQAVSSEAADRGIQERMAQLLAQWGCLRGRCQEQERWLRELLALAERFWHGLSELAVALSDTQQLVLGLEEAGGEPEAIRTRLRTMQALREEIDALQGELDTLGSLGVELMASCGDPDKPDVTKSLDDLYSSWHSLSRVWTERNGRLEEQLQAALSYQDTMQRLLEWLDAAELRIAEEFLVGGDLDMVQQQLAELKEFKRELYQCKVDVESLRHQGGAGHGDPPAALSDFRQRWDHLEEEIVSRQHQLEAALLGLGQFQHQLAELLQWLSRTAEQLRSPAPLRPDLQSCEIELAKHKVLRTDVMSHARTVQSVTEAGQGLLLSSLGDSVEGLQRSLQQLEQHWELVRSETESRQLELENNLSQVQDITLEITELLQWLEQVELQLFCSKPAWGHPDATKEKLNAHLELCRELEARAVTYRGLRERLQRLLDSCRAGRPCSTEHSLRLLEQKWESVQAEAQERKERLAEGLTVTTEFHGSAQELLRWVAHAEELLGSPAPPSFVLDTVTAQIQEHKALVKEANAHGEKLGGLEAVAARLKDFSRKQDGAVIQNLVLAARERLGKVLQRAAERGAVLEEARKRSKQFSESRRLLLDWMDEVEQSLEVPQDAATSQEEIKCQLAEHKAFQKVLRAKRPVYEATLRSGRALREAARLPQDLQPLEELLGELKERWDALCSHAAERQHKLEENLLFSGKFTDALQALMDWLYRAEPQLSEDVPVAGDRDLVGDLVDKHKVFQKELGKRASCIKTLKRSVRDLTRGSSSVDSQWLQRQVEELSTRWDLVCRLSLSKQARLEAALRQAEEFHTLVHSFLGRLTESEKTLKYGVFPEEEAAVQECQAQLQELMQSLQCQQLELECITSLGEEILSTCHPDSIITIKSWVTVAKSRFQEVRQVPCSHPCPGGQSARAPWGAQRGAGSMGGLGSTGAVEYGGLWSMVGWGAQGDVEHEGMWSTVGWEHGGLCRPAISASAPPQVFMEELNRKQPDVEKVTKSCKRKLEVDLGPPATRRLATRRRSGGKAQGTAAVPLGGLEPQTPLMAQLLHRWQQLWLLALDRQYRLETALQRLRELEEFAHFDFGVWRKRYMQWISQMKSRVLDVFRGIDRDQDGRISQREFIESVLASKFPTNILEMNAVATIFDMNGDGFIDYYEFVSALHPNRDPLRRSADADQIQDEVNRQVAQCNCAKRFQVEQISANRYRFGESQQLRMVRILRSTLMVRVGGGWIALDEFLVKNDPCRVKGRTNLKINEKYLSSDIFGAAARCAGNQSASSSKVLSPSRSNSSLSLYSSASAPSSPLARKSVLRRTRSGDRCPRSRGSGLPDGAELQFSAAEESLAVAPPEPPEGSPPERCSPCR
ncbi:plectin [Passer montanus]|uniref:plectin n=1 Tax=Passer montanus TaxID=9160 RepID=UPI0019609A90|nr:plectin [Passer montanus]